MIQSDLIVILPEIVISVYAMLALLGAVYTGKDRLSGALTWLTAAVMALVAMW
ncbi:MAG: NADH-quinone oxidoreductase subunit N, partial [Ilumatobacteraceae bacterium]